MHPQESRRRQHLQDFARSGNPVARVFDHLPLDKISHQWHHVQEDAM